LPRSNATRTLSPSLRFRAKLIAKGPDQSGLFLIELFSRIESLATTIRV
jgi:hypothetical protein